MRKTILLAAVLALMSAHAGIIDSSQARQIAQNFISRNTAMRAPAANANIQLTLAYEAKANAQADYYVFNRGTQGGFVIVAGNDCVEPILAYSDNGTFDYETLPDNARELLTQYQQELQQLAQSPERARGVARLSTSVSPLLTTLWSQDLPFSKYTPKYPVIRIYRGDMYQDYLNSATGCVATAMAQIMKYYNYPERGEGSVSYTCNLNRTMFQYCDVERDFSQSVYQWDKMLNDYDSTRVTTTFEQDSAVATLCMDASAAVYTVFGSSSFSNIYYAYYAFLDNFGYSHSMKRVYRKTNTLAEWEALMRSELDARRPVFYAASSTYYGGHAFVLDGYDNDSYFHINWGWGGSFNGYFVLSLLQPRDSDDPRYEFGFNNDHEALIGIKPKQAGEVIEPYVEGYYTDITFTTDTVQVGSGANFGYRFSNFSLAGDGYNLQADSVPLIVGFAFYDTNEQYLSARGCDVTGIGLELNNSYTLTVPTAVPPFEDGVYRMRPVFQVNNGPLQFFQMPRGNKGYYEMEIRDGVAYFSSPRVDIDLTCPSLSVDPDRVYATEQFYVSAVVENNLDEEYLSYLYFAITDDNDSVLWNSGNFTVNTMGKTSRTLRHILLCPNEGNYWIGLYDCAGNLLNKVPVEVRPASSFSLKVGGTFSPLYPMMMADAIGAKATIINTGYSAFDDQLELYLYKYIDEPNDYRNYGLLERVGIAYTDRVRINPGDTTEVMFHDGVLDAQMGERYLMAIHTPNAKETSVMTRYLDFTIGYYKRGTIVGEPENVTHSSFGAAWEPVVNTDSYRMKVSRPVSTEPIFTETFPGCTEDGYREITTTMDNYTDVAGWSGKNIFVANGGIRLGASNVSSSTYAYAPASITLKNTNNKVIVRFQARNVQGSIDCPLEVVNTANGACDTVFVTGTEPLTYQAEVTTNKKNAQRLGFRFAEPGKVIVLSNVQVFYADADMDVQLIDTDDTQTAVTALEPDMPYLYKVRPHYDDGTWGGWSNIRSVVLGLNLPGDVNGDGVVDVTDVNLIINAILNGNANAAADVNGDGQVDVTDVNLVINLILG